MRRFSRRRLWGAVVSVALTMSVLLSACGGKSSGTGTTDFTPTAHDFVLIRQLLAARAKAVLDGDQSAFMKTVDPDDSSFRASELVEYQNLQRLPVGAMSYESGTAGLTPAAVPGNDPTASTDVTEHVELQGTDTKSAGFLLDMTFVRRGSSWFVATDSLDDSRSTFTVARLWQGPPITVVKRPGGLLVVAEATQASLATNIANVVTADLARDAHVLHIPVQSKVVIDLTTGGQVMKFGNGESAAGVLYPAFAMQGDLRTTIAGWRIKVNPDETSQLHAYPQLLRHELTHFLLRNIDSASPKWLVEGIAQYVGYYPNVSEAYAMSSTDLSDLLARKHELLDSGFFGNEPTEDYAEATATVAHLIAIGGMAKLLDLMRAYLHIPGNTELDRSTQALKQVYGQTPTQVADGAFSTLRGL